MKENESISSEMMQIAIDRISREDLESVAVSLTSLCTLSLSLSLCVCVCVCMCLSLFYLF
jgi:hypothetical protein